LQFGSSGAHDWPGAQFASNLIYGALPADCIIRFQAEGNESIARRAAITKDTGTLLTADGYRLVPLEGA